MFSSILHSHGHTHIHTANRERCLTEVATSSSIIQYIYSSWSSQQLRISAINSTTEYLQLHAQQRKNMDSGGGCKEREKRSSSDKEKAAAVVLDVKDDEERAEEGEQVVVIWNNKVERHKVGLMRAIVETKDPTSKDVDDLMLRRFLRARDLDIEKASNFFLKYHCWRQTFLPKGFITEQEIPTDLAHNKVFLQGLDKQGRPIGVAFGGKHFPTKEKGGLDEFKRFVVYALEKVCSRIPRGQEKFVGIGDLKGWGYSNCDIRGYLGALSILQDCYPERLGKLYLVHVPYIFMTAWKLVYPFIDNNTRKKIVFVENKKLKSTLLEDIDESQLPEIYGGKQPLVPIQES